MAGDISLLGALRASMRWHQERQRVLAENVANGDTVGYQAKDLAPLDFSGSATAGIGMVKPAVTNALHIALSGGGESQFAMDKSAGFETTPDGNGVTLEDQMMKLTANQLDYQLATSLYSRGLGLIRTALKRTA